MKKIFAIGGAVLAVLVIGVLALAALQPDTFRIQRAASIKAPPERVFGHLDDFRAQIAWSPWEKKDPAMKRTFSGAARGKGAVYEWDGNDEIGKGRIEITDTTPPSKVAMRLDIVRPFEGHNVVEFRLEPKGEMTIVTWAMHGPQPFIGKIMNVFIDCEKMVGKEFDTGLASLKAIAER